MQDLMNSNTIASQELTVGEIAASDYRKAQVLKTYGIDFCCGGKKTLQEACDKKNVSKENVVQALNAVGVDTSNGNHMNFNDWDLDFLIKFIENNHHQYVRRSLQPIQELADKVARVHGGENPALVQVASLFRNIAAELQSHLQKEENILFPCINTMVNLKGNNDTITKELMGVQSPVKVMEMEHEEAGEGMRKINELTNNYTLPVGACASYTLLYKWLQEFEEDLHQHVHLENNILFPKAIQLENELKN